MNDTDFKNLQELTKPKPIMTLTKEPPSIIKEIGNIAPTIDAAFHEPIKWEKPKALEKEISLPKFPVECLPLSVREYVEAVAESTATAVDMASVASLAVIASAVQKKYKIKGKDDYDESLNIYALIIAEPAERKSSVMREMTRYTKEYEHEVNAKRWEEIDDQAVKINSMQHQISKQEKSGAVDEALRLKAELRELETNAIRPLRLIADDVTPEALTSLLAENNGALSVCSAEGGFFDTLAGKYSNSVSIDSVLKAHCGDDIYVDRRGRPKEYIKSPALTILLSVQNDVIRSLFSNGTFKGRGLNARFLYSKPTSRIGSRNFKTEPIPTEAKIGYKKLLYELHNIPFSANETNRTITLSNEAYLMLESYFDLIEPELIGNLQEMGDWAGKLPGAALRISGLLHCMNYENLINSIPVSQKTMMDAITIANYFLDHSRAAYQLMGINEEIQQANYILKKLEQKPKSEYKRHEIFLMSRNSKINRTKDIEPMLDILADHNYIAEIPPTVVNRPGKKPDLIYKLNPIYFKF